MPKKRRNAVGLTALQLDTVRAIARERGLDLPADWQRDRAYCFTFLERLSMERRDNPKREVVRFLNNVTREVEAGATIDELSHHHQMPATFAATMHLYALKERGYATSDEWRTDLQRLNESIEEIDAS